MKLSKKVLLSLSFVGILAGGVAQGMDGVINKFFPGLSDETKQALTKAGINTVVFGCILASGLDIVGNLVGKVHAGLGKWVKPIACMALCKLRLKNFEAGVKEWEKTVSLLPDVDDKKLVAVCKKALVKSGVPNADKLQVKLDKNYSNVCFNGYTLPSIYLVPIVVINAPALEFVKKPISLHETGHQADVERFSMHNVGKLVIIPLGVVWVVQPAAKKITEYVCEPLLKKGVDLASSLTERVTGSKKVANGVSGTLSVVKEIGKYVGTMGIVFVSCIGIEALNAVINRKMEVFADDFACKHTKDAWELGMQGNAYNWLAETEKLGEAAHPIISWINGFFDSHPSGESRADKHFFYGAVESFKKIAKSDANQSLVNTAVKRLVTGKNKENMFEEIVNK